MSQCKLIHVDSLLKRRSVQGGGWTSETLCVYVCASHCKSCLLCFIKDAWKWFDLWCGCRWLLTEPVYLYMKNTVTINALTLVGSATTTLEHTGTDFWTETGLFFGPFFPKMLEDNTKQCSLVEEHGKLERKCDAGGHWKLLETPQK